MLRMAAATCALLATLSIDPATAQLFACEQKEYAQYTDAAKAGPSSRISLAFEHCRNARTIQTNYKLQMLAVQHRQRREEDEAKRNIQQCEAAQTKIISALTAVGDDKNLQFLRASCKD